MVNLQHARPLIGLTEENEPTEGTLSVSQNFLIFAAASGSTASEQGRVLAITPGRVRIEKGGRLGKIGRKVIPFGGGSVLAAASQAQLNLLTVEFFDSNGAYHGAVFSLPQSEASEVSHTITFPKDQTIASLPAVPCTSRPQNHATMLLEAIKVDDPSIPVEYRVLLYERLVAEIRHDAVLGQLYREGDRSPSATCPSFTLSVTLNSFRKGNAVVRATAGPLGSFVGVTSLTSNVRLSDSQGNVLLNRDFKASKRGDSDSLDVSDKIARKVTDYLKKISAQHPAS